MAAVCRGTVWLRIAVYRYLIAMTGYNLEKASQVKGWRDESV